jgi:hypothetical protein
MEPETFLSALADMTQLAASVKVRRTEIIHFAFKRWYAELDETSRGPEWGIKELVDASDAG